MTRPSDRALAANVLPNGTLLGVVRGDAVHQRAEQVIASEPDPPSTIFDVVSTAASDLSGLRSALWPMTIEPDPPAVLEALLGGLSRDLDSGRRSLVDTLTIVRQMRSMVKLPAALYAELNAALVDQANQDATPSPIAAWLQRFAGASVV